MWYARRERMSRQKQRPYRALELPEIISGILALLVVLWEACFARMASGQAELAMFMEGSHLILCGLVWFNTLVVLIHFATELVRKHRPSRFLCWQLVTGLVASLVFTGGLWRFLPIWTFFASLLLSFLLGTYSLINISAVLREQRRMEGRRTHSKWSPAVIFFTFMVGFVLVSTLLLLTPGATRVPLSFTDALFTCASAISITGLTCVDIASSFTPFGKLVLLADIQLGAMGVMTFTYFVFLMVGKKLAVQEQVAISSLLDQQGINIIPALIRTIIFITLSVEAIGAVLLYYQWKGMPGIPQEHLWFLALFHAVSAFCNAGISLFPDNMAQAGVARDFSIQSIMMALTFAGTLGFGIYLEALSRLRHHFSGKRPSLHWSVNSRFVLRVTLIVVLGGGLVLGLLGWLEPSDHSHAAGFSLWEGLWNAIGRSAGFNISSIQDYGPVYQLFLGILMFIGGNPAGTGGGVFAPVFALCALEVWRVLRGQHDVEMFGRRIARNTIERAMATVVLSTFWIVATTMLLLLLEPSMGQSGKGIIHILFLEVSAYSTTGFSLCDVASLSSVSKWILTANMLFGRVGMFTFMLIFIKQKDPSPLRYSETRLPLT